MTQLIFCVTKMQEKWTCFNIRRSY